MVSYAVTGDILLPVQSAAQQPSLELKLEVSDSQTLRRRQSFNYRDSRLRQPVLPRVGRAAPERLPGATLSHAQPLARTVARAPSLGATASQPSPRAVVDQPSSTGATDQPSFRAAPIQSGAESAGSSSGHQPSQQSNSNRGRGRLSASQARRSGTASVPKFLPKSKLPRGDTKYPAPAEPRQSALSPEGPTEQGHTPSSEQFPSAGHVRSSRAVRTGQRAAASAAQQKGALSGSDSD